MKKHIKVSTDASYDAKFGIGTWAYWITIDDEHLKASGVFKQKLPNSSVAELLAIERALRRVDLERPLRLSVKLTISTDSMWAIHALMGQVRKSPNIALTKAVRHSARGYEMLFKHVKAHTYAQDEESIINEWCDQEAKRLLRIELGRAI